MDRRAHDRVDGLRHPVIDASATTSGSIAGERRVWPGYKPRTPPGSGCGRSFTTTPARSLGGSSIPLVSPPELHRERRWRTIHWFCHGTSRRSRIGTLRRRRAERTAPNTTSSPRTARRTRTEPAVRPARYADTCQRDRGRSTKHVNAPRRSRRRQSAGGNEHRALGGHLAEYLTDRSAERRAQPFLTPLAAGA